MTDVGLYTELGLTRTPASAPQSQGQLNQEAFLELMIAQFRNQDPFKPMENGDFLGQLAQFGTVSGPEDLQRSVGSLASSLVSDQALQASGLIDRSVLVPRGDGVLLDGQVLAGAVDLPASTGSLAIQIMDASGALVQRIDLGTQPGGLVRFEWDGRNGSGERMPPGSYSLQAISSGGGVNEQVPTLIQARVDSVTLGNAGGVLLNLEGLGEQSLADVRRIGA